MQNVIDTIRSLISEHLIKNPHIPLHTGEVMNIWTFYTFVDEAKRYSQMALNHLRPGACPYAGGWGL